MIELQSLQPLTAVNFLIHSDQRTFNASAALILKIRHNHSCHARSSILQLCELPAVTVPDCGSRGADELAPTAMPCLAGPACTAWWSSPTSELRPFSFPLLLVSSRFPPSRLRDPTPASKMYPFIRHNTQRQHVHSGPSRWSMRPEVGRSREYEVRLVLPY